MPVIILPPLLDPPAIVRVAAHSSGAAAGHLAIPQFHTQRPAGTGQAPEVVKPSPSPLPAGRQPLVDRPAVTGQPPEVVRPVEPLPVTPTVPAKKTSSSTFTFTGPAKQ